MRADAQTCDTGIETMIQLAHRAAPREPMPPSIDPCSIGDAVSRSCFTRSVAPGVGFEPTRAFAHRLSSPERCDLEACPLAARAPRLRSSRTSPSKTISQPARGTLLVRSARSTERGGCRAAKGAGLRPPSRRGSWVRIPPPAPAARPRAGDRRSRIPARGATSLKFISRAFVARRTCPASASWRPARCWLH